MFGLVEGPIYGPILISSFFSVKFYWFYYAYYFLYKLKGIIGVLFLVKSILLFLTVLSLIITSGQIFFLGLGSSSSSSSFLNIFYGGGATTSIGFGYSSTGNCFCFSKFFI